MIGKITKIYTTIYDYFNLNNISEKKIIKITTKEELRKIILSGEFDNSIQIKNTEHICHDGTIYDYSELRSLNGMFAECSSLTTIPLFDTSNVTDMSFLFYGCSSLISIPLLNTSKVSNFSYIFSVCHSLPKLEQVKFFYQKDKLLLKSLEMKNKLTSEQKLEKLDKLISDFDVLTLY